MVVIDLKIFSGEAILLHPGRRRWLMNYGRTMFSQLMDFVPIHNFSQCIKYYNGNYKIKSFSCWDQYLCMAFAQLTYRESLRDIPACMGQHRTSSITWASGARFQGTPWLGASVRMWNTGSWRIIPVFSKINP